MAITLGLWSDEEYHDQNDMPIISDTFKDENQIVLHLGETYEFLRALPDSFAKLIITSPPYNIGKEYEKRSEIRDYLEAQRKVIEELVRLLDKAGSICWQVGNYVEDGEVFPLDILYYGIFKDNGLKLRNRIVWRYNHGLHTSKRFSGRYETILWFTKSEDYTFNLDPVRVPSKYPGKRHHKGPNKGKPSGNPLGKNPSDLWEFVAQQWDEEVWEIPQVKAAHPEKTIHPAQYPIELVERCVLALTDENDWVLDPYCGVGSSLIAALRHDRRTAGCDKEPLYLDIAKKRIEDFFKGNLSIRPMDRELYKPQGKVSKVPNEWKNGEVQHVYANKESPQHSLIAVNLTVILSQLLREKGSPCRVFNSDVKIRLSASRYVHPDIAVSCDERDWSDPESIQYPGLIIEVLSPSTEARDRGQKFTDYRARPSLQEYALVNYAYQGIELFRREKGHLWSFQTFLPDADIELASLGIRFPVTDVYQRIIFPSGNDDQPA